VSNSPFIKVEATHYTEIGYHGKDVDNIIKDLSLKTLRSINESISSQLEALQPQMLKLVNLYLLDFMIRDCKDESVREEKLRNLENGLYDELMANIVMNRELDTIVFDSIEDYCNYLTTNYRSNSTLSDSKNEKLTIKVSEARRELLDFFFKSASQRLDSKRIAISEIENEGIVFIDEIDKLAMEKVRCGDQEKAGVGRSPSTEGVQRDLLPLIEGTTVSTKIGDISTENILFICAGAFSSVKETDLMPELLGRLPIRIKLQSLTRKEYKKILTEVDHSLLEQYTHLLKTENIDIEFAESGINLICQLSEELNLSNENLGARRLHSVIEKVLENILFLGSDNQQKHITIDEEFVQKELKDHFTKADLRRYLI